MTTRCYYGIQHTYGANAGDTRGDHIGNLYVFSSLADRDAWVADGNPYFTQGGARTAASMANRTDRRFVLRNLDDVTGRYDFRDFPYRDQQKACEAMSPEELFGY